MDMWALVAGICGGIVLLGNAGAMIYKWIRPAINVKEDVEELKRHKAQDYERLQRIEKMQRDQTLALLSMVNHMIDGNGIDKLKETRDDLQESLIGFNK